MEIGWDAGIVIAATALMLAALFAGTLAAMNRQWLCRVLVVARPVRILVQRTRPLTWIHYDAHEADRHDEAIRPRHRRQ